MHLGIVIPAHNEDKHIGEIVRHLHTIQLHQSITKRTIIVVDDGSEDNTSAIANAAGALVITHSINLGKGSALKTGCETADRTQADIIITMDGDGQHKAEDIHQLIEPLLQLPCDYDLIIGARHGKQKMPYVKRLGNFFLSRLISYFFNLTVRDTQSGFKSFTREAYQKIRWESNDYFVETEILAGVSHHGLRYQEVPIRTEYLDRYKGTTIFDGIKIVFRMLKLKTRLE